MPFDWDKVNTGLEGEILRELRLAKESDPQSKLTPAEAHQIILRRNKDFEVAKIIAIQEEQNQRIQQLEHKNRNRRCVIS